MFAAPSQFHAKQFHKHWRLPLEIGRLTTGWVLLGAFSVGVLFWIALGSAINFILDGSV